MGKQGICRHKLILQQLIEKQTNKKKTQNPQNKLGQTMNRIPPVLQAPKPRLGSFQVSAKDTKTCFPDPVGCTTLPVQQGLCKPTDMIPLLHVPCQTGGVPHTTAVTVCLLPTAPTMLCELVLNQSCLQLPGVD